MKITRKQFKEILKDVYQDDRDMLELIDEVFIKADKYEEIMTNMFLNK